MNKLIPVLFAGFAVAGCGAQAAPQATQTHAPAPVATPVAAPVPVVAPVITNPCAATYSGQHVTVTGKIASDVTIFVHLVTLTDAAGTSCLTTQRNSLGPVGSVVTVTDYIAIHNPDKTPNDYLYPASDPAMGL